MSRRWRNLPVRSRQRHFDPPWPLTITPTAPLVPWFREQSGWRPRWAPNLRRNRFFTVPATPTVAGPGLVAPQLLRQSRRPALPTRRGDFATPVPAPQAPPAVPSFVPSQGRRSVARSLLIRRGEFLLAPPSPPTISVPPPPKPFRAAARRLVVTRRGEFLAVPLAGVAGAASTFVCQNFTTTTSVASYSATSTVDARSATATVDAYAATTALDTYSATAVICGR